MIGFLQNMTVKVQRRTAATTNALGELNYGKDSTWPVAYASALARIEYWTSDITYGAEGEHVTPSIRTVMFFNYDVVVRSQDRLTVLTSDAPDLVNKKYIVDTVDTQWDLVGNVHHYIVSLVTP